MTTLDAFWTQELARAQALGVSAPVAAVAPGGEVPA